MKKQVYLRPVLILISFFYCFYISGQSRHQKLKSPVLFKGDSVTAYRAPAVIFNNRTFHMFFYALGPLTEAQGYFDRNVSICIAWSTDLAEWNWRARQSKSVWQQG